MGFWLGCMAVAGLFEQSLSGKIRTTIKANQNNYHLQYEGKNAVAPRKIRFKVLQTQKSVIIFQITKTHKFTHSPLPFKFLPLLHNSSCHESQ